MVYIYIFLKTEIAIYDIVIHTCNSTETKTTASTYTIDVVDVITNDTGRFGNHENRIALAAKCPIFSVCNRIVGGEEACLGEYPWLALIGYTSGRGSDVTWSCGGSLIGNKHILTAAHCVTGLPGSYKL